MIVAHLRLSVQELVGGPVIQKGGLSLKTSGRMSLCGIGSSSSSPIFRHDRIILVHRRKNFLRIVRIRLACQGKSFMLLSLGSASAYIYEGDKRWLCECSRSAMHDGDARWYQTYWYQPIA